MEKLEYADAVTEQVHVKTFQSGLRWECYQDWVKANPTPTIRVSIQYRDDGPDAAVWDYVVIKHPVGNESTLIKNPASPGRVGLADGGSMLKQVNEIFRHVFLEPREKEFEVAMRQLREPYP